MSSSTPEQSPLANSKGGPLAVPHQVTQQTSFGSHGTPYETHPEDILSVLRMIYYLTNAEHDAEARNTRVNYSHLNEESNPVLGNPQRMESLLTALAKVMIERAAGQAVAVGLRWQKGDSAENSKVTLLVAENDVVEKRSVVHLRAVWENMRKLNSLLLPIASEEIKPEKDIISEEEEPLVRYNIRPSPPREIKEGEARGWRETAQTLMRNITGFGIRKVVGRIVKNLGNLEELRASMEKQLQSAVAMSHKTSFKAQIQFLGTSDTDVNLSRNSRRTEFNERTHRNAQDIVSRIAESFEQISSLFKSCRGNYPDEAISKINDILLESYYSFQDDVAAADGSKEMSIRMYQGFESTVLCYIDRHSEGMGSSPSFTFTRWVKKVFTPVLEFQTLCRAAQSVQLGHMFRAQFETQIVIPRKTVALGPENFKRLNTTDKDAVESYLRIQLRAVAQIKGGMHVDRVIHGVLEQMDRRNARQLVGKAANKVHCECALIAEGSSDRTPSMFPFIGCSKLSCLPCSTFIDCRNEESSSPENIFLTQGSHHRIYEGWRFPGLSSSSLRHEFDVAQRMARALEDLLRVLATEVAFVKQGKATSESTIKPEDPVNELGRDFLPMKRTLDDPSVTRTSRFGVRRMIKSVRSKLGQLRTVIRFSKK